MSDETPKPEEPFVAPPLPEAFSIPDEHLAKWYALPGNGFVTTSLTRDDFDNLFASINQTTFAVSALQQCLFEYSNGRIRAADERLSDSRQAVAHAHNAVRMLFSSIMKNAVAVEAGDGAAKT